MDPEGRIYFKGYPDQMQDERWGSMTHAARCVWFECLGASKLYGWRGKLPNARALAWRIHEPVDVVEAALAALSSPAIGWVERDGDGWLIAGWDKWQSEPKAVAERVAKYRERKRAAETDGRNACNETALHVTPGNELPLQPVTCNGCNATERNGTERNSSTTTTGACESEGGPAEEEGKPDPTEAYRAVLAEFGLPDTGEMMGLLVGFARLNPANADRKDRKGALLFTVAAPWVRKNIGPLLAGEMPGQVRGFREHLKCLAAEAETNRAEAAELAAWGRQKGGEHVKATADMLERCVRSVSKWRNLAAGMDGTARVDDTPETGYSEDATSEVRA